MKLLQASVGTAGIVAAVALAVPVLFDYLAVNVALLLCGFCAEITGSTRSTAMLAGIRQCVQINLAVIATLAVMMIFSISIIITVAG